ncbi:MAG TPA: hypothetical protein VHZ32_00615 [Rhizomicrobium sp.]|jgi:hypothetical protein|nr:hypothetical protein [Rhizomicrobium sp.]
MARRTFSLDLATFGILAFALGAMAAWLAFVAFRPIPPHTVVPRMIEPPASAVPPAAADAPPYTADPRPLSKSSDGTAIAPDWIEPVPAVSHDI